MHILATTSIKYSLALHSVSSRLFAFLLVCGLSFGILNITLLPAQEPASNDSDILAPPAIIELPQGFDSFQFGMSIDMVETLIADIPYLDPNLENALSLLPRSAIQVLSVNGDSYVDNAHFQFDESGLISIILNLDDAQLDHFALYSHLTARYGEPDSLHPRRIEWRSPAVILLLERPLTVKYIARSPLEARQENASAAVSEDERSREAFIELF